MKNIGILVIIFLIVILIGISAYLGYIPGISTILGADKSKDLGIKYTQQDFNSGRKKSGVVYETLPADTPPQNSLVFKGNKQINTTFSNEEMTALINNRRGKYMAITHCQVKFNADGTGEIAGIIERNKIASFLTVMTFPQTAVNYAEKTLRMLPPSIPFYVKGKAAMMNNRFTSFTVDSLEVSRLPIPMNLVHKYQSDVASIFENFITTKVTGFYAKRAGFEKGILYFEGTLPEIEATVTK